MSRRQKILAPKSSPVLHRRPVQLHSIDGEIHAHAGVIGGCSEGEDPAHDAEEFGAGLGAGDEESWRWREWLETSGPVSVVGVDDAGRWWQKGEDFEAELLWKRAEEGEGDGRELRVKWD